jgi:regulator of sirC expression with transglutaminase-like and TPR domain
MSLLEYLQDDPTCSRLAEGAVHAVAPLLEDPDPSPVLRQLEEWHLELAAKMPLPWNFHKAIDALNDFLFVEQSFEGDRETYGDPRNAVLPEVLRRRKGLPIALSLLWIDQARRLGFEAVGVGLPGHFIAAVRTDLGMLCFDPFNRGQAVGHERAAVLVHASTEGRAAFHPSMLAPTSDRALLTRLVRNLHRRFAQAEQWPDALWTATHLVLLQPEDPEAYKARALVHLQRLDASAAMQDIEAAEARSSGSDPDLEALRRAVRG